MKEVISTCTNKYMQKKKEIYDQFGEDGLKGGGAAGGGGFGGFPGGGGGGYSSFHATDPNDIFK